MDEHFVFQQQSWYLQIKCFCQSGHLDWDTELKVVPSTNLQGTFPLEQFALYLPSHLLLEVSRKIFLLSSISPISHVPSTAEDLH